MPDEEPKVLSDREIAIMTMAVEAVVIATKKALEIACRLQGKMSGDDILKLVVDRWGEFMPHSPTDLQTEIERRLTDPEYQRIIENIKGQVLKQKTIIIPASQIPC